MTDFVRDMVNSDRVSSRVCRDGEPVSEAMAAEVIARLESHYQNSGETPEQIATTMGVRVDLLASAMKAFSPEQDEVIRIIDRWLETAQRREVPSQFVRTGVAEKVLSAGRYAIRSRAMVLAVGPAGIGKTVAAQALSQESPGTIYLRVKTVGVTPIAVMESLAGTLGRKATSRWTGSRLFAWLEAALQDTGRLLIVDECHRLAARRHDESLHVLRDLHDGTGIPMLMLGMPELKTYIQAGLSDGESMDQLASRIALFLDLSEDAVGGDGGGRRMVTVEDVRRFLAARMLRVTPGAEAYLVSLANAVGAGSLRVIGRILSMAATVAKGCIITEEMLQGIQVRRLGSHAASALEQQITRTVKVGA